MSTRTDEGPFANWSGLLRLKLKRDRFSLPVWILGVLAFAVCVVPAVPSLAGSADELAVMAEMMKNPAMIAMCGVSYGDTMTLGILYTQLMLVWTATLVGIMNILLVIRHTRTDEDEGRLEVIRALPTGKLSNLASVGVIMIGINVIVAVLVGITMPAFGVESIDLAGSLVYGAALGGCGLVFAVLTMVIVQLVQSARGAMGMGLTLLGVLFMVRAYGDVGSEIAALISPLGLIQRTYPYYGNHWWPVFVLVGTSVVVMVLAFVLVATRDLGEGLLPAMTGRRSHASIFLSGEWGLIWRLTRGPVIAWAATVFILAAAYGAVMPDMEDFVRSSPIYQAMFGIDATADDIVGPTVTMLVIIMTAISVIPVLTVIFNLGAEERKGRLDYVVGKSVSRVRLFVGYALLAGFVAVVMQLLIAVGFHSVAAYVMADPMSLSLTMKSAFNFGATLIGFAGLGLFLMGWAKKLTWVAWGYLAVSFLYIVIGGLLNLPRWVERLTPFGLLQRWPTETFSWWPWVGLVFGGVILAALGAVGFRRRDVIPA